MELLCYQEVQTVTGDPVWYVIYVDMEYTMDEKKKVGFPHRAPNAIRTRKIHWFCHAWKLLFLFHDLALKKQVYCGLLCGHEVASGL